MKPIRVFRWIAMKRILLLSALLSAALLGGCSKKDASSGTTASAPAAPVAAAGPRTIEITATDAMKYSVTSIQASPGEEIKVVLTNAGMLPKEAMAHNFVLLKAGSDPAAFAQAGMMSKATDYIPAAMTDQVLAHTKLLGSKQSDEVTIKVPTAPGDYPYLCTFPAHFMAGMKGVLTVK
jgi:azurin